jgi:hypothetical protein
MNLLVKNNSYDVLLDLVAYEKFVAFLHIYRKERKKNVIIRIRFIIVKNSILF